MGAPEELQAPRRHERGQNELNHDEHVAARRAKKAKRRKSLEQKVNKGEITLKGLQEREAKLAQKNMEAKQERASQGAIKEAKKRLRASDLLSQAAENAASDIAGK